MNASARPTLRGVARVAGLTDADAARLPDPVVAGAAQHSSRVRPGEVFLAARGARHDARDYLDAAIASGAVAVVAERPAPNDLPVPVVQVPEVGAVAGAVSAYAFGEPSAALQVVGVTGTNGKTSTVHLTAAALSGAPPGPGVLSGLRLAGPGWSRPSELTTPQAADLQRALAAIRDGGCRQAVVEVSSHALLQGRVDGLHLAVAAFTNLSRDHLDAHGDMDAYFATKARLFEPARAESAVVAVDDAWGRRLAARIEGQGRPVWTTSAAGRAATVAAEHVRVDLSGARFDLRHPGGREQVRLALLGPHQVDNALVAAAAALRLGVDARDVAGRLGTLQRVDGRLVPVDEGQPFRAFVDYMHNPGGQARVLEFLAAHTPGRLIAVVGATAGRDEGKWAQLGAQAARWCRVVVVTDESPYDERPERLRAAVAEGARAVGTAHVEDVAGRDAAFDRAVRLAGPQDTLVVAGRGHDRRIVRAGRRYDFDDEEQLRRRCRAAAGPGADREGGPPPADPSAAR